MESVLAGVGESSLAAILLHMKCIQTVQHISVHVRTLHDDTMTSYLYVGDQLAMMQLAYVRQSSFEPERSQANFKIVESS